jgi:hypothetical protein
VKTFRGIVLAVAGVLVATLAAAVPGPSANPIFIFASPNTRESLTDEQARARLASFEQINATAVADRAACALTHSVQIGDSLGVYDRFSENSFIVEGDLSKAQAEYLAALLGSYSKQEFVLLFLEEPAGGDRMWVIKTPQSLDVVIGTLRKWRLTPVTLRPGRDQNEIWFVDTEEKRAEALKSFTSDVKGSARVTAGVAEMLGNPARPVAVKEWRRQIGAIEKQTGLRLSRQLSSDAWRHARQVHTCSTEISTP